MLDLQDDFSGLRMPSFPFGQSEEKPEVRLAEVAEVRGLVQGGVPPSYM